jgi:putative FmdB family regulatory protein
MPMFEFICHNCGNQFEKLKKNTEDKQSTECPNCNSVSARNPKPSRVSVICRSLKNDVNDKLISNQNLSSNRTSSSAAIKLVNVKNARLDNNRFENLGTAISAENVEMLTGENVIFKDVQNPIEHKNSEIDLKNVSYEKS